MTNTFIESPTTTETLIEAWVHGWALSRSTGTPQPVPGGHGIAVGLPGHIKRYVLPHLDAQALRALTAPPTEPGTWLKVCAPAERLAPHLPTGWRLDEVLHLMQTRLTDLAPAIPAGYRPQFEHSNGAVTTLTLHDAASEALAARGKLALWGGHAVIDQVVTEEAHRRRGLGSVVMGLLCRQARQQGAHTGVLVATNDGRALYGQLGWTLHSPLSSAVNTP